MIEVNVTARSIQSFEQLVSRERITSLIQTGAELKRLLGPRAMWNINSTAVGGGVAEMLRSLLRYARGLGIQNRWLVVEGPPEFFRITKRLHNALHDSSGDGSPLGPEQAKIYEEVLSANAMALDAFVRAGDVVICHDPQTAGLVPHLLDRGALVVWRCHVGYGGTPGPQRDIELGWNFLRKYVEVVPIAVFSRGAYAPSWLPRRRAVILAPTIDPFSTKNQLMDDAVQHAILHQVGLIDDPPALLVKGNGRPASVFTRDDGSVGRVDRKALVLRLGRAPTWDTPLVVQVSRWDRMKDPRGVLEGFARHVIESTNTPKGKNAELVLAGPHMRSVADDPEGPQVFADVEKVWRDLPEAVRLRTHLAQIPMDDEEENAAVVNALQRHATVIVQKSLREGFGLTVTEAMWKSRPVVASAVGGIQDQIDDGIDGLLLRDPTDLRELGGHICRLLDDERLANRIGEAAHQRVLQRSLSIASLEQWAELVRSLLKQPAAELAAAFPRSA